MINVKETIELNKNHTILVCEMFEDSLVTDRIKSNIGVHESFEVEKTKLCFSNPATRNIVMFNDPDSKNIKRLQFL